VTTIIDCLFTGHGATMFKGVTGLPAYKARFPFNASNTSNVSNERKKIHNKRNERENVLVDWLFE